MSASIDVFELEYAVGTAHRLGRIAHEDWFAYLDSCRDHVGGGRFDVVAARPHATLVTRGPTTQIESRDGIVTSEADPFSLLEEQLDATVASVDDLPFCTGALGYFAYDLGRRIEQLPASATSDLDAPDMAIGIYDWAFVVDHDSERACLVSRGLRSREVEALKSLLSVPTTLTPPAYAPAFHVHSTVRPEITRAQYGQGFREIKRLIRDGDCYQVNFAQRFSARASGDSWHAYQQLRALNPAPYSAFLRYPAHAVLSSSPERFIQVHDGMVETKPIKGTRPRSGDAREDQWLAESLLNSEKDRAENLMIVDLLRNDLGRSCEIGSVEVPKLFDIESFATVHHLVSTVRGRLAEKSSASRLLRNCFPGGSITGAPKIRAMEIIESLEAYRRSIYCGSIGYLSRDGGMDTNIAIRTMMFERDRLYCWAGGGIVMDSDEDDEYQECLDKAAAMLKLFAHSETLFVGH